MGECTKENGKRERHMATALKNDQMGRYATKACGTKTIQYESDDKSVGDGSLCKLIKCTEMYRQSVGESLSV